MSKRLLLAAASAASLLWVGQAAAGQIWYTTAGTSNVFITGVTGIKGFYIPNVSLRFSVVGDTANYVDDPAGVRLIPVGSPSAFVSATGMGTVVVSPGNFIPRPVSFTDFKLSLAPPEPGEHDVFGDGFGDFDGKYAYGDVSGSLVDFGSTFGGAGLAGWDGVSALAPTPVDFLEGDDPGFDTSAGTTWHLLNLDNLTFTATLAGGSADTPLVDLGSTGASYSFDFSATGGVPVYVDPLVATGYDYVLGAGSPLITSAMFPTIGSSLYSIYALGDLSTPLFSNVVGGQTVDFTSLSGYSGGINGFSLRGVDVQAGLDPNDDTAFVTALTFAGDGRVQLTQTAITTSVGVPEPSSWALMLAGFMGLGGVLRRNRRSGTVLAA
ncbi:MAG TPA: PEPxxWA-CTERM sorting domain-containing protein [Phenylobacterium sp.]|nr:PEPxxWA-CTERM sorting domain-containing protein [Phenylobacterium sp.]